MVDYKGKGVEKVGLGALQHNLCSARPGIAQGVQGGVWGVHIVCIAAKIFLSKITSN